MLTGMVLLMALLVWCLQVQSGWLQVLLALPALMSRRTALSPKDLSICLTSIMAFYCFD